LGDDLSHDILGKTARHLTRMLTLDIDGQAAASHLMMHDAGLGRLIQAYPGFRPVFFASLPVGGLATGHERSVDRGAGAASEVIRTRMAQLGERSLGVENRSFTLLPSPEGIVFHGTEPWGRGGGGCFPKSTRRRTTRRLRPKAVRW
jgi:hypothetical protein